MWNTVGCCFLCSKSIGNSEKAGDYSQTVSLLQNLLQNLKIDKQISRVFGDPYPRKTGGGEEIEAELCELCKKNCARLSVLFQRLEKVQMEIIHYLEETQKRISDSAKLENYSKRIVTNSEAIKQYEFVENLRNEILNKRMKNVRIPRVCITQERESMSTQNISNINVEFEGVEEVEDTSGGNIAEESIEDAFETISPPPSITEAQPQSLESVTDKEQASKINQLPSTSKSHSENDRKLLSMKLLAAQIKKQSKKSKSSEFFTKDSTGKYNCRKCKKSSECRTTIEKHFKSVHLKRKYNCDICNVATFTQSGHLAAHKKTCAQKLVMELAKEKDPKFTFICNRCGNRFETSKKLRAYEKSVHQNANRYGVWDVCGKIYSSYNNLRLHNEVIHLFRKLNCKVCNKIYKDAGKFRKHEKNCSKPSN